MHCAPTYLHSEAMSLHYEMFLIGFGCLCLLTVKTDCM